MKNINKCCFCGKTITFGASPFPVVDSNGKTLGLSGSNEECCEDCDVRIVFPFREKLLQKSTDIR